MKNHENLLTQTREPSNSPRHLAVPLASVGPRPLIACRVAPIASMANTSITTSAPAQPSDTLCNPTAMGEGTAALDQTNSAIQTQGTVSPKRASAVDPSKRKRKADEPTPKVAKRPRTTAPGRSAPTSNDTVVDSILWSTPPHDARKGNKPDEAPAPKPKPTRKPRSKPWTCKLLADLGSLIQNSVPWSDFAESNGKTLEDVLETYSIVVSMPLLDFAERGEKRIAQKKFRDMRQKYKEMEKDAVRISNEQAKKEAEEYFGVKKKGKSKETKRTTKKSHSAAKTILQKAGEQDASGKA